jgi:signal transduction histidine kinase
MLSLSVSPVISYEARVEGKVMVLHDVTAQHELEQARTTFIATISHELRTPLTPIMGYLDLLFQPALSGPLNENQALFLSTIRKNAQQMNDLLGNVILIARIEAGAAASRPADLRLAPVLEDVLRPLRPEIESKGLALDMELPSELPSIRADPEHIRIVLGKVLDNAARYTSEGQITLRAVAVRRQIEITIEDTGPGIGREDMERIFTRFSRGGEQAGLAGEERGAGLGLSIARRLIDQQGGSISLASEPGKGTLCTIRVPMEEHAAALEEHEVKIFAAED